MQEANDSDSLRAGQRYGLDFAELLELHAQGVIADGLAARRIAKCDK